MQTFPQSLCCWIHLFMQDLISIWCWVDFKSYQKFALPVKSVKSAASFPERQKSWKRNKNVKNFPRWSLSTSFKKFSNFLLMIFAFAAVLSSDFLFTHLLLIIIKESFLRSLLNVHKKVGFTSTALHRRNKTYTNFMQSFDKPIWKEKNDFLMTAAVQRKSLREVWKSHKMSSGKVPEQQLLRVTR